MIESIFLIYYDATLLNLSTQTVNLWAYLITYLINPAGVPSSNFFLALFFVVVGVTLYVSGGSPSTNDNTGIESNSTVERSSTDNDSSSSIRIRTKVTSKYDNSCCCYQWYRILTGKRRRDSEIEIVQDESVQASTINYHSVVPNVVT
jgi:hypothetical protein